MRSFVAVVLCLLVFQLGASVGSFLLVVVRRSHRGADWIQGSSVCESCGHSLAWWEMIPAFSYFALRGRCVKCGVKIDPSHVLAETYLGLVWLGVFGLYQFGQLHVIQVGVALLTHSILWALTLRDILYPENCRILLGVALVCVAGLIVTAPAHQWIALCGTVLLALLIGIVWYATRRNDATAVSPIACTYFGCFLIRVGLLVWH